MHESAEGKDVIFMYKPKYITRLENIPQLTPVQRKKLKKVSEKFVFRTNEYYQSLIDWDDPNDPIRRIVMPSLRELHEWGNLDASSESSYTVAPGCEHKYRDTALLLVNDVCGAYCRFCFRKRLFMNGNDEVIRDVGPGIAYIRKHTEISNVLLTGGDPLLMSTRKLENIIRRLRDIEHVKIIRIGTKLPAFNPYRILNDETLPAMLAKYSARNSKIYLVAHFNHPNELTDTAVRGIDVLHKAGVVTINQTPLIRGVNDDPGTLGELFDELSYIGVPPYYVFLCRPTLGNKTYSVPVERALEIFDEARMMSSGLAKRARLAMSHAEGKIEALGMSDDHVYFKFHRAADFHNNARLLQFKRNPNAYWFDDYEEAGSELIFSEVQELIDFDD